MKNLRNSITLFLNFLPAVILTVCVVVALSGYVTPEFTAEKTNQDESHGFSLDENTSSLSENDVNENSQTTSEKIKVETVSENGIYKDGTYIGVGNGFAGQIKVQVIIKDGNIADIKILSSSDTSSYLQKASSILSKILSSQSTNVDTVSGATYSSVGIIEAVRNALEKASVNGVINESSSQLGTTKTNTEYSNPPKVEKIIDADGYKDGVYVGSGAGFAGEIKVQVKVENGKISEIKILNSKDGKDYMQNASSLLSKIIATQSTNVDTISGATFSSAGLIEAVRDALKNAKITSDLDKNAENTKNEITIPVKGNFNYKDGVYIGRGEGYHGEVVAAVSIKNKNIDTILILKHEDDDVFFSKAESLVKIITQKQTVNVDTISGATFSSEGILEAVNNALKEAERATKGLTDDSQDSYIDNDSSKNDDVSSTVDSINSDESLNETVTKYIDGIYTATAVCNPDDYQDFESYILSATITIKNDNILSITNVRGVGNDYDTYNDRYINRAANGTSKYIGVISQILKTGLEADVDVVSGATCSSNALIEAVNAALKNAVRK
ncbi:MAG: FMN-binding protein [Ruminococcus sp.]|nr:FMN-binding protein [Ruminococcus sp.]